MARCLNCENDASFQVVNTSASHQLFCDNHIPGFLSIAKDLGGRLLHYREFDPAIDTSPEEVAAEAAVKPSKKKKAAAPVEPSTDVVEEPVIIEEAPIVEEQVVEVPTE